MKMKLLTSIVTALALTACGSTQPEFTAEKDVTFKPDLEKHSLAYNIALSSGAPNAIKDAEVPQEAYDRISGASHAASFVNGFMIGGFGASLSFGWQSLLMDRMNGFDNVKVSLWIPVDSLDDYGSSEFESNIDKAVVDLVINNYVDAGDLVKAPKFSGSGAILKFSGESCKKYISDNAIPDEAESIDECVIGLSVRVVRPILENDWTPELLNLPKQKYVLVTVGYMAHQHTMTSKLFPNGFAFFPAKFNIKYKENNEKRIMKVGDGYPYYQYQDRRFVFVKPQKNS